SKRERDLVAARSRFDPSRTTRRFATPSNRGLNSALSAFKCPERSPRMIAVLFASMLSAQNATTAQRFVVEPPTLVSLGFEWRVDGDDNRNATVAVTYRRKGDTAWKQGPPLLRIGHERINENALQYVVPNG